MKTFVLFCVVVAATSLNAQNAYLTPEQKAKVKQNAGECAKDTGVSDELIAEIKKGNFPDDEGLKKFFHCFFKKVGVVGADDQLHFDVAVQKLPEGIDKAAAEQVLNECEGKTGKDKYDTLYEILKCYYSGTKQHVIFE